MKLLEFQREAVTSVVSFFDEVATLNISSTNKSRTGKNVDKASLAWITSGYSDAKQYCPLVTLDGHSVPNVALCIPTGGGKTIVGLSAAIEVLNEHSYGKPNFVVWMVPSEAIYSQVLKDFSPGGTYYSYVEKNYGKKINIKQVHDTWIDEDLDPISTTILLITFQSIIRKNSSKSLQVYRNADKVSSLSILMGESVDPSLYILLKKVRPIFVIDESHRYYTEIGRDFFKQDNIASFIIELSATHKHYSSNDYPNIVFSVSGKTLISEQLIKKPIVYHSLSASSLEELVKTVISHQQLLESRSREALSRVAPKVLISSEFTGAEQAEQEYSAQNIKSILVKNGVTSDTIAIKSSELDELSGKDLDDVNEKIRFVITKRALMEGWDCKSIFTIMLVNKIGADVTNFQLIGRGLRQPYKKYSKFPELNELHLYTNSISHDASVKKLTSFLSESGLSDAANDLVVASDSRVLQSFTLKKDLYIKHIAQVNKLLLNNSYITLLFLERNAKRLFEFTVDDSEVDEPEEITQKIDLSKNQVAGILQGRPRSTVKNASADFKINFSTKLYAFLFNELNLIIPHSTFVNSIVIEQINRINDYKRSYRARSEILLKIKHKFNDALISFLDTYYHDEIIPVLKIESSLISQKLGLVININSIPDLAMDEPFKRCLYGNIPKSIFNDSELSFARYIDRLPNILWMRNTPQNGVGFPFSNGTFYPDFLLIKNIDQENPVILFIETKGAHLLGSADSNSKLMATNLINKKFNSEIKLFFGEFSSAIKIVDDFISH